MSQAAATAFLGLERSLPPVNSFDQRGFVRPTGGNCDIGAFELDATPLAVILGYFLATGDDDQVDFVWQTVTELGTVCFNLFGEVYGVRTQLNDELIPLPVIDSVEPVNYSAGYANDAEDFYFWEVEVTGARSLHGPFALGTSICVAVDVGGEDMWTVYFPFVSR